MPINVREFSSSGTTIWTVPSWLVQHKPYINLDGKKDISALVKVVMIV